MASHANVSHLDDVAVTRIDRGPLQGVRQRLGAALGTRAVGCSRLRMGKGERAMPVHVHQNEEELAFVLAGGGLSWQNGVTYEVSAGDTVLYPAAGEAHSLIAGPEGLDVLVFASGTDSPVTFLPRARAWWLGSRWLPEGDDNPFVREAKAGKLEMPQAVQAVRAATLVGLAELEPEVTAHGRYGRSQRDLGEATGSKLSGLRHVVIEAGQESCPAHWHTAEEELFVVLTGGGEVELGPETFALRAGSLVARPPATSVEHLLRAGPDGMTYLAYGTRRPEDICHYPRTGKILIGKGTVLRVQDVDYWDGEG